VRTDCRTKRLVSGHASLFERGHVWLDVALALLLGDLEVPVDAINASKPLSSRVKRSGPPTDSAWPS
jgi:hypothetical protein